MRKRPFLTIVLGCAFTLVAATLPVVRSATAAERPPERPLRVSLFPYVPDGEHIRREVQKRWDRLNTGVALDLAKYEKWDCYSESPPDDLDVFELDAINLDWFVKGNWVSPLTDSDVENPEDVLDFA